MNAFARQWGGIFAYCVRTNARLDNVAISNRFDCITLVEERKIVPGIKFAVATEEVSLRNYQVYHLVAVNPVLKRLINHRCAIMFVPMCYYNITAAFELLDPQYENLAFAFGGYFTMKMVSRIDRAFIQLLRSKLDRNARDMWRLYINKDDV
jgi:hypothetical protein